MRRCLAWFASCIAVFTVFFGCESDLNRVEEEILQVQDRRFAAIVSADTAALNGILADSVRYTHASGRLETKRQHVGRLARRGIVYHSIRPVTRSVQVTASAAVVTGIVEMDVSIDTLDIALRLRFTDVYFRGGAGWQQVAWQSTHAQ